MVLDSVGIGALPDADQYGDTGSNTLGHSRTVGQLKLPVLEKWAGQYSRYVRPEGPGRALGYMAAWPGSTRKDTITGHWELAGNSFRSVSHISRGFPAGLIEQFTRRIGRGILGNVAASGTEIIARLGKEHMETGKPIVYTSADSVFQIAAHEEVIPLAELYAICQTARELLHGEYKVARVIARPFIGVPGAFQRTANRRDFALEPEGQTVLDALAQNGREVVGIGKIHDIFSGRGIARSYKTRSNQHGIEILLDVTERGEGDLVFTNLVDFDMLYGHRNDAPGYARALEEADRGLGRVMAAMGNDDVLIVTADHGCDPTFPGTDHTREYVPLLVYGERIKRGVNLGTRQTFADVAAAVAEMLAVEYKCPGTSFWHEVKA